MKIYILRHEDRTHDCSFFSPLTEKGLIKSNKLIKILKSHNINLIFSSPFIRTLQTIHPYLKEMEYQVNIEYGLSEIQHSSIIAPKTFGVILPNYMEKHYKYNPEYKSFISHNGMKYPEESLDCYIRTKKMFKHIIEKYYRTDFNILLVTHQGICTSILRFINDSSPNYKNKLSDEIKEYKKGQLSLIFDNCDWKFEKIN